MSGVALVDAASPYLTGIPLWSTAAGFGIAVVPGAWLLWRADRRERAKSQPRVEG